MKTLIKKYLPAAMAVGLGLIIGGPIAYAQDDEQDDSRNRATLEEVIVNPSLTPYFRGP